MNNVKRTIKRSAWLATAAVSLLATSMSYAGDCRQAKFKFINKWTFDANLSTDDNHIPVFMPAEIRVKKVAIVGNDGTWKEDINNHHIDPGATYTTGNRRLNSLDSGETGQFTVEFDYRVSNGWVSGAHGPFSMECNDGDILKFTIMHS